MSVAMVPAHRLGLTGGIGSGKSTAAAMLARMGAVVIDADAIAHETMAPGGAAIDLICSAFGSDVLNADGGLDRAAMRQRVFTDPQAKARLEAIVHPLVRQRMAQQAQAADAAGARCIVFDIPLLLESGHWRALLHRVLVIDCSEATQIARVVQRSGLSVAEVEKIMATQATRAQRLAAADLVVLNDGISLEALERCLREIGTQFGL